MVEKVFKSPSKFILNYEKYNHLRLKLNHALERKTSYFIIFKQRLINPLQQITEEKPIIGRVEKIDFPNLSLFNLDAKIDTGAYTSSIHCHKITFFEKNNNGWVRFFVLDPHHPEYEEIQHECRVHKIKNVRSSNGLTEKRVIIRQKVFFCGKSAMIQLSLADRSEMRYPVLIGRRFISTKFLVDVSKKFLYK